MSGYRFRAEWVVGDRMHVLERVLSDRQLREAVVDPAPMVEADMRKAITEMGSRSGLSSSQIATLPIRREPWEIPKEEEET